MVLGVLAAMLCLSGLQVVVASTIECVPEVHRHQREVNGKQITNIEQLVWFSVKPSSPNTGFNVSYRGTIDEATGQITSENPGLWSPLELPWSSGYLQFTYQKNGQTINYFADKMPAFSVIHDKDATASVQMLYVGADLDCTLTYSYTASDAKLVLQVSFAPKVPLERYRLLFRGNVKGGVKPLVLTPTRAITRTTAAKENNMVELDTVKEYRLIFGSAELVPEHTFALLTLPGEAMKSSVSALYEAHAVFDYGPATRDATFFLYFSRDDGQAGLDYFNAITLTHPARK